MKQLFNPGDVKRYTITVNETDTAQFGGEEVHPVYATFALARDAEWACRLFVLDMKEPGEEGIGTRISVDHHAPALVGETVIFYATLQRIESRDVICYYEAYAGERLIASGEQGQKILPEERLSRLFQSVKSNNS